MNVYNLDRTPMEESIRMTEDRDKWRKYVHGVAKPSDRGLLENREQNLSKCTVVDLGKGKGKRSIALRKKPHRYGNSRAIWDHTVLPATRQR